MRSAGLPLEELPGPPPIPLNRTPRERAEYAAKLLLGNIVGEKNGPPSKDPDLMAIFFDTIANSMDTSATNGGVSIQWDFKDADPWFIRIDNGSTEAVQGRLEAPDVTLRCRYEDWVDVSAGREDPRRLLLTGRLRPKGRIKSLWRLQKVFPR
jgi:putative sterol carrier protein